ncbi:MAG: L-threonylcarbamoyladenylate synthase [bacterium]|nr:L-threonylcarbamoyladenylate synthase [bacterium]
MTAADYGGAAKALRRGAVMLYPTETVYGLGCDARNTKGIERIYALKGRSGQKPFIVLVKDIAAAKRIARFSPNAKRLARKFWPGSLTLVLRTRKGALPARYFGKAVALRVSPHPFVRALFRHIDFPLVSTSANRSGKPATRSISALRRRFGEKTQGIDIIIDGGTLPRRKPSTVVDFTGRTPRMVREGAISWKTIVRNN